MYGCSSCKMTSLVSIVSTFVSIVSTFFSIVSTFNLRFYSLNLFYIFNKALHVRPQWLCVTATVVLMPYLHGHSGRVWRPLWSWCPSCTATVVVSNGHCGRDAFKARPLWSWCFTSTATVVVSNGHCGSDALQHTATVAVNGNGH